jgi:NO-binding membrane sensor protein with MHYT domain
MLACRRDVSVALNVPLTILSVIVAVAFTFVAFITGEDVHA